jgi:hypothetical protein
MLGCLTISSVVVIKPDSNIKGDSNKIGLKYNSIQFVLCLGSILKIMIKSKDYDKGARILKEPIRLVQQL